MADFGCTIFRKLDPGQIYSSEERLFMPSKTILVTDISNDNGANCSGESVSTDVVFTQTSDNKVG